MVLCFVDGEGMAGLLRTVPGCGVGGMMPIAQREGTADGPKGNGSFGAFLCP